MPARRRHLRLVTTPPRARRTVSGNRFRTEAARDEFRRRWNTAQARLARTEDTR
jgi:hypothetical protein